jgi:hypothetical protein
MGIETGSVKGRMRLSFSLQECVAAGHEKRPSRDTWRAGSRSVVCVQVNQLCAKVWMAESRWDWYREQNVDYSRGLTMWQQERDSGTVVILTIPVSVRA